MELSEGDVLEILDKDAFTETEPGVGMPTEFEEKGIPDKLIIEELNVSESPGGAPLHEVTQKFPFVEPSTHEYHSKTLEQLLEAEILEKDD